MAMAIESQVDQPTHLKTVRLPMEEEEIHYVHTASKGR